MRNNFKTTLTFLSVMALFGCEPDFALPTLNSRLAGATRSLSNEPSESEKNFFSRSSDFFRSPNFPKSMESLAPLLKDADSNPNGVLIEVNGVRWRIDLSIADYLDALADLTREETQIFRQIQEILDQKPIENFPKLLEQLPELEKSNARLAEELAEIRVHFYDENYLLVPHSFMASLAKIPNSWMGNHPPTQFYNSIVLNPEGSGLLKFLARNRENYFTRPLTLVKLRNSQLRKQIESEIVAYSKSYCETLRNSLSSQAEPEILVQLKCEGKIYFFPSVKVKEGEPFVENDETLYRKRAAQGWFNAIQARPDKRLLLKYLQYQILLNDSTRALPSQDMSGVEQILLTPQYIYKNMDLISPLLKQYNYSYLVGVGDDEYLLKLRKWIWANHELIEQNLPIKIIRKPGPQDAQTLYPDLIAHFPGRPWEPHDILYDQSGRPVLLTGFIGKIWRRGIVEPFKATLRPENIAGLGVGIGLGVATANPIVGSVSGAAARNIVKVYRYGRPLKNVVIPFLTEAALLSIPALGFVGGPLAEAAFWGAVKGLGQAALSGDPYLLSAVVGAGLDMVEMAIPANIVNPSFGKSGPVLIGSAFYEIGWSAAKGATQGAVVQFIDSGDTDKMFSSAGKGALFRASGVMLQIAFFGPRISAPELSDKEFADVQKYYEEHLGVHMTRNDLARLNYRASDFGLIGQIRYALQGSDANRSYYVIGPPGANMTGRDIDNRYDQAAPHEAGHYADAKDTGSLKWIFEYLFEAMKHGFGSANKFEHYHYKNGA